MPATTALIDSPSFGQFTFDAVFSVEHRANVTATQHPVQAGASVADHAFVEPEEISLEIGMSDTALDASADHSVNAFAQLRAIMDAREPVRLITRLRSYDNMLITSLSAPDDYTTMYSLKASVMLQRINIVSVSVISIQQTVSASKSASTSSTTAKKSSSSSSKSTTAKKSTSTAKTSTTKKTTKSTTAAKQTTVLYDLLYGNKKTTAAKTSNVIRGRT